MKRLLFLVAALWLGIADVDAKTLYVNVNDGTCDNNTTKANNDATHVWCSIGRATWGNADRTMANSGEAADDDDLVLIAGGTYEDNTSVCGSGSSCNADVFYNPTNSGSAGHYITFECTGTCNIHLQNWNGPACCTNDKSDIKWFADTTQAHKFVIKSYALLDNNAASDEVDIFPDTGPVICWGGNADRCWIEGFDINGGAQADYSPTDNYTGIRVQFADDPVIRNNKIRSIHSPSSHGYAINLYHSLRAIIEHNDIDTSDICFIAKDNASFPTNLSSLYLRFTKCYGADRCWEFSIASDTLVFAKVYQNLCVNSLTGTMITGGAAENVDLFNNTYYNIGGGTYPTLDVIATFSGSRWWNNITSTARYGIYIENGGAMLAESLLDSEHNVWNSITTFYVGSDGSRPFSGAGSYTATYTDQDQTSPVSTTGSPGFADEANGDFRLCTGVGIPHANCAGASAQLGLGVDALDLNNNGNTTENIPVGAFLTNLEVMGIETVAGSVTPVPSPSIGRIRRMIRK